MIAQGGWIFAASNITIAQIGGSLLAIPAFLPATICCGYLYAWFTDLHDFRGRSFVERIFWSLPLSLAVSTILSVLIGKFFSLTAVVVFYLMCAMVWVGILAREWQQNRRAQKQWNIGLQPLGGKALLLAGIWIGVVVLSLADIQVGHKLLVNVAMLDQSYRVDWTESVLHTGVPPDNPLYMYMHPAPMRNYYFWYVVCAAVAKMTGLPVRAVFTASCVWAGFAFAAIIGLYLKHFLAVGVRLRRQFLLTIALLTVTGLDICVVLWNLFVFHLPPPADLEAWSRDGIVSWLHTLFWAPHHLVSMLCCMLVFLLTSLNGQSGLHRIATVVLIALALASAFGLSIYAAFAFFLAVMTWSIWQVAFDLSVKPTVLIVGGACSLVLLVPYLRELIGSVSRPSGTSAASAPPLFSFAVRQMISPNGLLAMHPLRALAEKNPLAARNAANLLLLVPGYLLELGFFFAIFVIYLVPRWREHARLSPAHRSLVFLALATVPFMSFIRSGVLQTNDFAWRSALFVQFPLLLLASELLISWNSPSNQPDNSIETRGSRGGAPQWLRSAASFALIIGVIGTTCQVLAFRFLIPLGDMATKPNRDPNARSLSQKAYISAVGYAQLDKVISRSAVVQYNPEDQDRDRMAMMANMLGIDHQTAIADDKGGCGSELGGDPAGCPLLAVAIDTLYDGASANQARAICHRYGIQYLIARAYDPVWNMRNSWVWTLRPVVSTEDFLALSCN